MTEEEQTKLKIENQLKDLTDKMTNLKSDIASSKEFVSPTRELPETLYPKNVPLQQTSSNITSTNLNNSNSRFRNSGSRGEVKSPEYKSLNSDYYRSFAKSLPQTQQPTIESRIYELNYPEIRAESTDMKSISQTELIYTLQSERIKAIETINSNKILEAKLLDQKGRISELTNDLDYYKSRLQDVERDQTKYFEIQQMYSNLQSENKVREDNIKDLEFYVQTLKRDLETSRVENQRLNEYYHKSEHQIDQKQTDNLNLKDALESAKSEVDQNKKTISRLKDVNQKLEDEARKLELKLQDVKFDHAHVDEKLREKDKEIYQLTEKISLTRSIPYHLSKTESESYADQNTTLYSHLTQKQKEVKELILENRSLKTRLNERSEVKALQEMERKIQEQESIIEILNNELETYKTSQDTNRMTDVMRKTAESFVNLNQTRTSLNRSQGSINLPKNNSRSFVVKSHISREKMRRDKMLKDLKEIQLYDYPNYESMKRLFKQLTDIMETDHVGVMIEKAYKLKESGSNYDLIKFYEKVYELVRSCLPDEKMSDKNDYRKLFKIIVKVIDNYSEMRKEVKYLRKQTSLTDELFNKYNYLFEEIVRVLGVTESEVIDEVKRLKKDRMQQLQQRNENINIKIRKDDSNHNSSAIELKEMTDNSNILNYDKENIRK